MSTTPITRDSIAVRLARAASNPYQLLAAHVLQHAMHYRRYTRRPLHVWTGWITLLTPAGMDEHEVMEYVRKEVMA